MTKIKMDKGSEAHLKRLTERFTKDVEKKYREGWKEHGGQLYKKVGMLKNAKDEVLDLWVYLDTLEDQLAEFGRVQIEQGLINEEE